MKYLCILCVVHIFTAFMNARLTNKLQPENYHENMKLRETVFSVALPAFEHINMILMYLFNIIEINNRNFMITSEYFMAFK